MILGRCKAVLGSEAKKKARQEYEEYEECRVNAEHTTTLFAMTCGMCCTSTRWLRQWPGARDWSPRLKPAATDFRSSALTQRPGLIQHLPRVLDVRKDGQHVVREACGVTQIMLPHHDTRSCLPSTALDLRRSKHRLRNCQGGQPLGADSKTALDLYETTAELIQRFQLHPARTRCAYVNSYLL